MIFRRKTVKVVCAGGAQLPYYATANSFAMDLKANVDGTINPGETAAVSTGLYMEIPKNYGLRIIPRSGLSSRKITVANSPGTIDSDYRGEVKILIHNGTRHIFKYSAGERLAQCNLEKKIPVKWKVVDKLSSTVRGSGGFGHTGK